MILQWVMRSEIPNPGEYVIVDLFTGDPAIFRNRNDEDGPSLEWAEGWDCAMHASGPCENPYPPGTDEASDWQDGYEAAMRD